MKKEKKRKESSSNVRSFKKLRYVYIYSSKWYSFASPMHGTEAILKQRLSETNS